MKIIMKVENFMFISISEKITIPVFMLERVKGAEYISQKEINIIIEYAKNLLNENAFEYEYEKRDWQDVVTAFTKAKWILENDSDAQIYYMEWYWYENKYKFT